ncbi:MAG: methylenetetrahydrofolate reductase [NAD(P)H] [bacterium]|jgi:methylenetetrahydrofolate reductase (NADPH)
MRLIELYRTRPFVFSIEVFPPKTEEGLQKLKGTLEAITPYRPDYFSVTYGAGGSSRENTHTLASHIQNQLAVEAMAHLTCVSHTRDEISGVLNSLKTSGIENIMALRGDLPESDADLPLAESAYAYASELVQAIRERQEFGIGVAGYPEGHVENPDRDADFRHQVRKFRSGADFVVTQLFLNNEPFLRWRDRLASAGVDLPLVPGLMPAVNGKALKRMASLCGVSVPDKLQEALDQNADQPEAARKIGLEHAARQLEELLREGVPGVHLYALNRLDAVESLAPLLPNRRLADVSNVREVRTSSAPEPLSA